MGCIRGSHHGGKRFLNGSLKAPLIKNELVAAPVPFGQLLSIREVRKMIGCSASALQSWANKGILPYVRLPGVDGGSCGKFRFRPADVQEFLEKHYSSSVSSSSSSNSKRIS